jgi:hypothetical protein
MGTLEDILVALEYIDRAYGAGAVPSALVIGATPRFIGDLRSYPSPFFAGIAKYSPHFTLDQSTSPPTLVPRSRTASLEARVALLSLQPDRYRRGAVAMALHLSGPLVPETVALRIRQFANRPAKYMTGKLYGDEQLQHWLETPGNYWSKVWAWDPVADHERVVGQLERLRTFAARHDIAVYVINLPEHPQVRRRFTPGQYEGYLQALREGIGDAPYLDLRTFLADSDFVDDAHPNWRAGIRVSRTVGEFVGAHRRAVDGAGDR